MRTHRSALFDIKEESDVDRRLAASRKWNVVSMWILVVAVAVGFAALTWAVVRAWGMLADAIH